MNARVPIELPRLPPTTRRAISAAVWAGLESLRAEPPQRLGDWASDNFILVGDSSHARGRWELWPFQFGLLDWMSDDAIEELDLRKSKRVGYTKGLSAFVAYNAAHRHRNQALWQPTDDDRDSFVATEIDPVMSGVPAVRKAQRMAKGVKDRVSFKRFRSSVAHFLGGKAARAYRRITVAVVMLDELDGFDQEIEKAGDPVTLAQGRLEGAPFPKTICGSTPRIKGMSHIEHRESLADVAMRYHITCPLCGVEHPLLFGGPDVAHGLKWDKGDPDSARHVCPHCHGSIRQPDYLAHWVGTWICERTGARYGVDRTWRDAAGEPMRTPRHVSAHIWAAYSPQRTWASIGRECSAASKKFKAGDAGPLKVFRNETLGETWEVEGERTDEHALQARAEPFPLCVVPVGALKITAGIDLQHLRWEIGVWGWGRGMESWPIDHCIIEGNPESDDDWAPVVQYLQRRYPQAWRAGHSLGIDATSIDSGHHTHAVYHWVRKLQGIMRVHAIKGHSEPNKPIKGTASQQDVTWRGSKQKNGVKVWVIGVDTAKDLLHGQLAIRESGPGYVHVSKELPREWCEQLTAEQRIPVKTPSGEVHRWVKRRPRNEVLDTRNYATHAAHMLGLHEYDDVRWTRLELAVQPPPDLFTPPTAPAIVVAESAAIAPPPREIRQREAALPRRDW